LEVEVQLAQVEVDQVQLQVKEVIQFFQQSLQQEVVQDTVEMILFQPVPLYTMEVLEEDKQEMHPLGLQEREIPHQ
jgi:hypothetical protein